MSQFKINDKVIHFREGLCVISDVKEIEGTEYFAVHSVHAMEETIYVPIANANNILREIMSVDEADKLLSSLSSIKKEFNPNTKQRRDAYKRRLASGDINDIAYLFYQLVLFTKDPEGVRLGPADNEMLNYAKNFLLDELSLTYQVERSHIEELVLCKLK